MPRAVAIACASMIASLAGGCAETLARNTTRGAVAAVKKSGEPAAMVEHATRAGTAGALEALTDEERREALAGLTQDVTSAAVRGVRTQLGEAIASGERPLAEAVGRLSQSALVPECAQAADRRACIHSVLRDLTRMTVTESMHAFREQLGIAPLVVAFVAGGLFALFVVFVVTTLRMRRHFVFRRVQPA